MNYVIINDAIIYNNYDKYIKKYLLNKKKINNFNNQFSSSSVIKLFQDIKNNRTIKVNNEIFYLKKLLRESDVLVISVGMGELANIFSKYDMNNNQIYFDDMYENIQRVIKEIKRYAYGKIIFLGYYNPTNYYDANIDRFFYDMNIKLERMMLDNDIIYIDLYELMKGNNYKNENICTINEMGSKKIASIIEYYLY